MDRKNNEIPAWMMAQALVVKAKNVLLEESIEMLYKEIEDKRMSISGRFTPMEIEKEGEIEQGLFLIRHLMNEKPNIMKRMSEEIRTLESEKNLDAEKIQKIESAKKFMLAVEQIAALTTYGMVFEQWFNDVSLYVKESDVSEIIAKSAGGQNTHRTEALKFLISSRMFKSEALFTNDERAHLKKALELCAKSAKKE